jgi:hypothetical protein
LKTYYELLGIPPDADPDEVKRAFRREIARYHPDKVQHLGPEFQEIASTRAAELTEAYRVLMDPEARLHYDASLTGGGSRPQAPAEASREARQAPPGATAPTAPTADPAQEREAAAPVSESLRRTQETLSQFVRKATLGRLRETVDLVFGGVEPLAASGFDAGFLLRSKRSLFQKAEPAVKLLVSMAGRVDGDMVRDTWPKALKLSGPDATLCVFLLGVSLAPARELASAIAAERRRTRQGGPLVVPVDARDWDALVPPDTPSGIRKLLERLKLGT